MTDLSDVKSLQRKFGRAIARQRELAGLTRAEVAARLGVDASTFYRIESGGSAVGVDTMIRLADMFQCGFAELLWSEGDEFEKCFADIFALNQSLPEDKRPVFLHFLQEIVQRLFAPAAAKQSGESPHAAE